MMNLLTLIFLTIVIVIVISRERNKKKYNIDFKDRTQGKSEKIDHNENIYMEGSGTYIKSNLNVIQGTIFLTSKKIMFCKRSGLFNAFAGPLLMHLAKGSHIVFEIELSNIKSINCVKHGLAKKFIFTNQRNEEYALQFMSGKDNWLLAIQDAVKNNNPLVKIKQIGDDYSFSIEAAEIKSNEKTSDEALAELKKAKDKFDLELITQEDYDKIKEELRKYIN